MPIRASADRPLSIERREFLRVSIRVPVLFRLFDTGKGWGEPREGLTENLSVGGLLLHGRLPEEGALTRAIVNHAPIALEFPLPDGYPDPVRGVARVLWVENAAETPEECKFGLRFREMMLRDRDRIVGFVVRHCL
jgi:hypothetical protein